MDDPMAQYDIERSETTSEFLATLEAEQHDLEAHVNLRLSQRAGSEPPYEPTWVTEALTAAWPRVIAEAVVGAC